MENIIERMFKHNDYRRLMEVRAFTDENTKEMVVEGKAVVFNESTKLFTYDGLDYYEMIDRNAFAGADLRDCFLKYNHTDNIMVMARTKNGTLQIEIRDDGVYIRAVLANTQAGRDLFELVKRGDIDKMSFAFNIKEESYNKDTRTWTVRQIDKLFDVAAVPLPAYESTSIYARRFNEVEARVKEVETLEVKRRTAVAVARAKIKLLQFFIKEEIKNEKIKRNSA